MRTIQMTIDDDLVAAVDRVSKELHTSRSDFIRKALREALARYNIEQLNLAHRSSDVVDHVTLSLGVACVIPNESSSAKQLIEAADCALYASKKNGRNRVSYATG
jgi:diguanylate cyclase (GGDEF)-like protein